MKASIFNNFTRYFLATLVLLFASLQTALAQNASSADIKKTETLDVSAGTVSFTLPSASMPAGSTCVWKIDGQETVATASASGSTITLPLTSHSRAGELTIGTADGKSQTLSFSIEPKSYGTLCNGMPFYADSYEPYPDGTQGDGSKEKPFLIATDLQLAKLAHDVNSGSVTQMFSGKYFKLTKDIDLSRGLWTPIGSWNPKDGHFFSGKFDGDGHSIGNMRICWINYEGQEASWGLFSRLNGKASNEAGFAVVTNLVIDNASVEKKEGFAPNNGTIKLGVLAADLTKNAEISNIIIRNSQLTDHGEVYDVKGVCRIGGIVGYLDNGGTYRVFNISANVAVNMHKNAHFTSSKAVTISGGLGCVTKLTSGGNAILPTNIYVHGPAVVTADRNVKGSVIAFYDNTYYGLFPKSNFSTLFFSPDNAVSGAPHYGDGVEQAIDAVDAATGKPFGNTFADLANRYIGQNKLEKKSWTYLKTDKDFTFSAISLKLERGTSDVLTVVDEDGNPVAGVYDWYVSTGSSAAGKVNADKCNPFVLPRQTYDQYVYATDGHQRTSTLLVKAIGLTATMTTGETSYVVKVDNDAEGQISNEDLGLDITYEWFDGTERLTDVPTSQNELPRPNDASKSHKFYCKVTVKSGTSVLLEKTVSAAVVVYLCPAGVTTADGKKYAAGKDNIYDPTKPADVQKNNPAWDEWGYSPEQPMLTWKGAYEKLSATGSWDENAIVLMGTSAANVTFAGFNLTKNYQGENLLTADDFAQAKQENPQLFRNTTITGVWETDFLGEIEITGSSRGLPIWGDTRFENLTFVRTKGVGEFYKIIYCQFHNLEMGEGLKMKGFDQNSPEYGTIDGAVTNALHIFGGLNNDGRFYPLNTPGSIEAYNKSMPHGREGFSINIKSGFYSCISVGGRQTVKPTDNNGVAEPPKLNGVMGTPQQPLKCTIDIDIDRAWNDRYNERRMVTLGDNTVIESANDYDAGVVLAGSHEGAMYADVDIVIKSGKVARVVNGTLGAQTELTLPYEDKFYDVPCNTFMGRANIYLVPEESEYNTDDYVNGRVVVTELYGGSTGRGHTGDVKVNNPFYGLSTVTIDGGTFKILPENNTQSDRIFCGIFGAGAGGMNGIGYGEDANGTVAETHTPDENIPYWNKNKTVMLYGPYAVAKDRLVTFHCYNTMTKDITQVDPRETSSVIIINDGDFGYASAPIDGIYAGGSGFMSRSLWTQRRAKPNKYGGNVYGSGIEGDVVASLTINGGEFHCLHGIFAGGRGTDYFFSTDAYGGVPADYKELGKTYGNVELNISGGIFHCPVFGGGYGVADAKAKGMSEVETLSNMARVYGQSSVNIQGGLFYKDIYGGGDMAVVESAGNATNVTIGEKADVRGSVFAGGNGRRQRPASQAYASGDGCTQRPDQVGLVIGNTNVSMTGTAGTAPSVYGNIFGGGNLAQVAGNTSVNIFAGNFAGQLFGGGNGDINGATVTSADVLGNTRVVVAQDSGEGQGHAVTAPDSLFSINILWNRMWDSNEGIFYVWDPNITDPADEPATEEEIYDGSKFFANGQFLNPHNVYGGGNLACRVGTYKDKDGNETATAAEGTGQATVVLQKGMTTKELLQTDEWRQAYDDDDNPHFSVFGGGYGRLTKVGSTSVSVDIEGEYGENGVEGGNASAVGIPNFTVWGVLGGGYAGTVSGSAKVEIDGKPFIHRVFGGGFGDITSVEDNTTGQVGGNTEVYVRGGRIHGDIFGGGAGLKPANPSSAPFADVARVVGTSKVDISDNALVYGSVYGGGDNANVGPYVATKPADYFSQAFPVSASTLSQSDGSFLSYTANGYRSFVNISGGSVFGDVFGGGNGLTKAEADEYSDVGRVNGNTLVHIVESQSDGNGGLASVVPYVWGDVYGGCAYGTVDGNTMVHIEGGMLGSNVFGGGFGDIIINNVSEPDEEVLGRKDVSGIGTYADVLGNTKVQMDGGAWIWNRKADINGNILTWTSASAGNQAFCNSLEEARRLFFAIKGVASLNDVTDPAAKAVLDKLRNDESTQAFFDFDKRLFTNGHNIFGGGNRACRVGTALDATTGKAVVVVNHSPLEDLKDEKGKTISMFDYTSPQSLCWAIDVTDASRPQFSVFGAGYGANTEVGQAEVYVQPGAKVDDNGLITVGGTKYRYLNQARDYKTYVDFEKAIYNDYLKVTKEEKRLYYGSFDGSDKDPDIFRRYHASRLAWMMGASGFVLQQIHGGGFAGYVRGDTYVETDCQLVCHSLYGAGLGAMPYGDFTDGSGVDFGKVGGKAKVFVKSANIGGDVFGGGAGIESVWKNGRFVDFPDMARVGQTAVHIYGRPFTFQNNLGRIERTRIYGNVYGGGDAANVGQTEAEPAEFSCTDYTQLANCATLVNVRGGALMSSVFAGGKGRLKTACGDYKKLGGVYGNACLIADRPVMHYPYWDDAKQNYLSPDDAANMAHPADGVNANSYSLLMGQVFGGCQNGTVFGNTLVTLYDGKYARSVYGGGYGNVATTQLENGGEKADTTSADVTGNTNLFMMGGEVLLKSYWKTDTRSWHPADIVDGVVYSPQYDHAALKFKIDHNIYAGGNVACTVGHNTYTTMTKGLLYKTTQMVAGRDDGKNFFESDEWREIYYKTGSPHFSVFGGGYGEGAIVLGDTYVNVDMEGRGSILEGIDIVAGKEYRHFFTGYALMDIVGGGYSGKVVGDTHIVGAGGVFCRRVFGGGTYSSVRSTDVELRAIDCRDIFGGGFMGDVLKSTTVRIGSHTPDPTSPYSNSDIFIHGNVYGGNDVSGYVNVGLNENGFFMDNGGDGTNITIAGGHLFGDVYGAGNGDYLYANDRNGNTKVTVNEYYPLNPADPASEKVALVYTVPMRGTMPSLKEATDAVKIVNINSWRPLTNKVNISIQGASATDTVRIDGNVYGGGNSATVKRVIANDGSAATGRGKRVGDINVNIGSHVRIGGVFMGCNGDALFETSEDNDFMNMFQKLNGDINDATKELNLADTIDWIGNAVNAGISTTYLATENAKRPLVYPHLIDLYFNPVETDIQGTLKWNGSETGEGLTNCIVGTFCCGGNRGNMNVMPKTAADFAAGAAVKKIGNVLEYTFPAGLTITEKIVAGCNNTNYNYKGKAFHEGGYLLGLAHSEYPFIKLNVKNRFQPKVKNGAYVGGNVYGGCFKSGTIRGDVLINFESDMLAGKDKGMLEKSNELLTKDAEYSALNIYGAGYGMDSYVYGNTRVVLGQTTKCSEPRMSGQKFLPCGLADTKSNPEGLGVSANFIYGGGQQGNVIGVTNIEVLNGHVFRAVTGGSYSGYVFGSTQVKVGYPTYYVVSNKHHASGRYVLQRADRKNLGLQNDNGTEKTPVVKENIYLLEDEWVSQGTLEEIVAIDNGNGQRVAITDSNRDQYFTKVAAETPAVGWKNVCIRIDEAVYGGGYSTSQGSSVLANNTTVLKFNDRYNVDDAFTINADYLEALKKLPGGTTVGFGGNTVVLVGDSKESEHVTISRQDMRAVALPDGTDLYGYYYKHYDNEEAVANNVYTYRYISLQDKYFYRSGTTPPAGLEGIRENVFYEYDSEGGIFGDGHLSYAQGFRSADVTGYGFAAHTIDNPKILNTFQRLDILRLEDNCLSLLGARDYTVNEVDKAPYSIARVGEIKMVANDVRVGEDGALEAKADDADFQYSTKARNYMGFSNNIHYVGALTSNVDFYGELWRNSSGRLAAAGSAAEGAFADMSYQKVKQKYIDDYQANKDKENTDDVYTTFQKRNDGTARNMIGIASGYAMKIQLCQEVYDAEYGKVVEKKLYGPIYGVVEMNLINVREDEGGGYVYADNNHQRQSGDTHEEDFLETTGNFVFPYHKGRYIVDDCFPTGYYTLTGEGSGKTAEDMDVHYWYVTGFHYYYNVNITGYTFKSSEERPLMFDSNNKDGLTVLSGLKSAQPVRIQQWKMRSGHPDDKNTYSSDLEYRNYLTGNETDETDKKFYSDGVSGGYRLYVGGSASNVFSGAVSETDEDKTNKGFSALLSMRKDGDNEATLINNLLPAGLKEDAKIAFRLVDMVDNTNEAEPDYFNKHLARKSLATLVLKAPAYEEYVSEADNKPIYTNAGKFYRKVGEDYELVESGKLDATNTYYQPQTDEFVKVENLFTYNTLAKRYEKVDNLSDVTIDEANPVAYYVQREYTYTIYLTIEYVQGPTVSGHVTIENCALPGEMVRVAKDSIVVSADQSFAVNGYYWRIGKREMGPDGKWRFCDTTPWTKDNIKDAVAKGYDTFSQADEKGKGFFAGCRYDKTEDNLDIPVYYYMNGYGIQLGVAVTGVDDIMQVGMQDNDRFVVHNFHRMDPHKPEINLHLAEAIARAHAENGAAASVSNPLAEPRIYLADQSDLTAFAAFVDSIGKDGNAPRYGASAQFVLQNDLSLNAAALKGDAYISNFAGTLHGNGHVVSGVGSGKALFRSVAKEAGIYNLGLSSGKISSDEANGGTANFHCCFEYAPVASGSEASPVVYRWDGTPVRNYTREDFRYGRVAYDLNEYYLLARNGADAEVLKYVYGYYANGDYQYACRADAITGKNTGITYLRIGKDIPNYEQVETRHDKTHPLDAARLVKAPTLSGGIWSPAVYVPLLNANNSGKELMNDFLFWGQDLQKLPADYPGEISSHMLEAMRDRVYRTAAYYGNKQLDVFHYNAYNQGTTTMSTYVHDPATTAVDFTCHNDLPAAAGMGGSGIFYAPVNDNATRFSDFVVKADASVTQNLLVYTAEDNAETDTEAHDVVRKALAYDETTRESIIKGHHIVLGGKDYATPLFHLVERTPNDENGEGETCVNNDLSVPMAFSVTDRAWYVRKPLRYANDNNDAWEGICLPFTVDKAVASLNGEITHFYGVPSDEENERPSENVHTLHHEYWLRGLTAVGTENNVPSAVFQRPASVAATGAAVQTPAGGEALFVAKDASGNGLTSGVAYVFSNTFFVDHYGDRLYDKEDNPYYAAASHTYPDYPRLTAGVPYIVRFPGNRYYEFDLSCAFYNDLFGGAQEAQTITFNAYGKDRDGATAYGVVTIPVTSDMATATAGNYAHRGTFAALQVDEGKVYGMNEGGTAFSDASALSVVTPFRTYMAPATSPAGSSRPYSAVINIAQQKGGIILPETQNEEDTPASNAITIRAIGHQRVCVESTVAARLNVVTTAGQLFRVLDVHPGTATYSGFPPGLYLFGDIKVLVK